MAGSDQKKQNDTRGLPPQPSAEDPASAAARAGEPASGGSYGTEPATGHAMYAAVQGTQSAVRPDGSHGGSGGPLAPGASPGQPAGGQAMGGHGGIGGSINTSSSGGPRAASGYPQVHDTKDPVPGSDRTPERIVGPSNPAAAREAGYLADDDLPEMPQHSSGHGLTQGELQRSWPNDEGETDGTEQA